MAFRIWYPESPYPEKTFFSGYGIDMAFKIWYLEWPYPKSFFFPPKRNTFWETPPSKTAPLRIQHFLLGFKGGGGRSSSQDSRWDRDMQHVGTLLQIPGAVGKRFVSIRALLAAKCSMSAHFCRFREL